MRTVTTLAELNDLAGAGELKGLVRVSNELYHEGPGLSSSGLKELLKSPAHYRAYLEQEQADSAALRWGRLVHLAILEPELYQTSVLIRPEVDGRTKEGKAVLAEFASASVGKEVVTQAENLAVHRILDATQKNATASKVFSGGKAEVSVYWTDEASGVLCKARADYLRGSTIFDLKTCYSAAESEFKKAVKAYRYDLSAAFYLDGFRTALPEVKNFAWVALEKTAPYCFGFYAAVEEDLNAARAEISKALATYAECQKSGVWPGLPETFTNLSLTGT